MHRHIQGAWMPSQALEVRHNDTTGGLLMSAYGTANGQTDIVYANGQAIAEIDQNNNVYELHNDHLGSPRYITNGADGHIVGEQAFGPYGESMEGTFNNNNTLPSGYRPVTGYTGHLNEEMIPICIKTRLLPVLMLYAKVFLFASCATLRIQRLRMFLAKIGAGRR